MSDKKWDRLLETDRIIRKMSPNKGMSHTDSDPQIRITLIRGFEIFNTRPYHNYETWSDGYKAEAYWEGQVVAIASREDLDTCLESLALAIELWKKHGGGIQDRVYTPGTFLPDKNGYRKPITRAREN